jgi:cysteine-rich repeat protein
MRIRHLVPAVLGSALAACSDAPPPDPLPVGWTDAPRSQPDEGVVVLPDPVPSATVASRDASLPDVVRSVPRDVPAVPTAQSDARSEPTYEPTEPTPDASVAAIDAGSASTCGDGVVELGTEQCDDGNGDLFDGCAHCLRAAEHVLITEIVVRPASAEMIEIFNPTTVAVDISFYALSDSAAYWQTAAGVFPTAAGTDFAARFPDGSWIMPGAYATVAVGSAASFVATYGKKPDYELWPGPSNDPTVPDMVSLLTVSSIGTNAGLTDTGEPIVLFRVLAEQPVDDIDYVFFGKPSASNPAVDKTTAVVSGMGYLPETPAEAQAFAPAPAEGSALHRCVYGEAVEARRGNGMTGHDETSERWVATFAVGKTRTPGGPPPPGLCP